MCCVIPEGTRGKPFQDHVDLMLCTAVRPGFGRRREPARQVDRKAAREFLYLTSVKKFEY